MPDISSIFSLLNGLGIGSSNPDQLLNLDANGNPINGQPYQNPGLGTKLFNPELARYVGQQNAQYKLGPALAAREGQNIVSKYGAQTDPIADVFPNQSSSQRGSAFSLGGYGNVKNQIENLAGIQTGLPQSTGTLNANTENNLAKFNSIISLGDWGRSPTTEAYKNSIAKTALTGALGEANRQSVVQKTLDSDAMNRLVQSTGIDPVRLSTLKRQAEAESGRALSEEKLKNYILETAKTEAETGRSNALFSNVLSGGRLSMASLANAAQQNDIRNQAWESAHPAPGSPLFRTPEGGLARNSAGVTREMQSMGGFGNMRDIMQGGGVSSTIKLPGGLNIVPTTKTVTPPVSPISNQMTPKSVENSWNNFKQQNESEGKIEAIKKFYNGIPLTPKERSLFSLQEWHSLVAQPAK